MGGLSAVVVLAALGLVATVLVGAVWATIRLARRRMARPSDALLSPLSTSRRSTLTAEARLIFHPHGRVHWDFPAVPKAAAGVDLLADRRARYRVVETGTRGVTLEPAR